MDKSISVIIIFFSTTTLLFILIGLFSYNFIIARNKKKFIEKRGNLEKLISYAGDCLDWFDKQDVEEIHINSYDNLKLYGFYLKAKKETKQTIILVHGYYSNSYHMSGFAMVFHEKYHFNVLMIDLRGHGKSDGKYIGFGYHDCKDLKQWVNYIINKNGEDSQVVLLGVSMGASTVCMASSDLPKNVKFIISDCAFEGVKEILSYHLKRKYKLPAFPLINITSLICKIKARYFFYEASALKMVKKSTTPILFVHGDKDDFVPMKMTNNLYNATNCDKDLLIVNGASHCWSYLINSNLYDSKIEMFISKYIK